MSYPDSFPHLRCRDTSLDREYKQRLVSGLLEDHDFGALASILPSRDPGTTRVARHITGYQVNSALILAILGVRMEFGCSHGPPGTNVWL